jgi:hypothetical protein
MPTKMGQPPYFSRVYRIPLFSATVEFLTCKWGFCPQQALAALQNDRMQPIGIRF